MSKNEVKGSEKMEKEFGSFRKVTFGGFNRKDVIDYIEKMRNETFEYKSQVEETVKSLNEKIFELESAARLIDTTVCDESEKAPLPSATGDSLTDIKLATDHLKAVADELCKSLGDFMEKLSKKGFFEKDEQPQEFLVETESETDTVSSILASMSFLSGEGKKAVKAEKENAQNKKSVEDILSCMEFLR